MKEEEKNNKKGGIKTKSDMSFCKNAETMTTVQSDLSAVPIMKDLFTRAIKGTISIKYGEPHPIVKGNGSALRDVGVFMEIYEDRDRNINQIISSYTDDEGKQMFEDMEHLDKMKEDMEHLDKMKEELAFYKSRNLWQRIINKHK